MTLTFLDLYNECAGQPWSMFDNDADSVEDFESGMKISINKAIAHVWNCRPWNFRNAKRTINTEKGVATYSYPEGILTKRVVGDTTKYGVKCNGKFLAYEPNYELMDEATGVPVSFFVNEDPALCLYPTPDDRYTVDLTYLRSSFGLNATGVDLYELKEDDDYIDIDERYETMFKNCVISLAMIYAIADESDENHSGYERQYNDAMNILIEYCNSPLNDKRIVW